MALSNWLTRDEWNACYFAGFHETEKGAACKDLGDALTLGVRALHRAGYKFTGIEFGPQGEYQNRKLCCKGNERVLVEILELTFDIRGRAKECRAWAPVHVPAYDWTFLNEIINPNPT